MPERPWRGARRSSATCLDAARRATAFHRTRSSPDGAPIIAAIRASLDDAGLAPEAIDTVNAHGTSTPENDRMEAMGIAAVFGERAASLPVTSNKSMIGHTLTAAGRSSPASLLSIRHGRIPADDQLPATRIRHLASTSWARRGTCPCARFCRTPSASAARIPASSSRQSPQERQRREARPRHRGRQRLGAAIVRSLAQAGYAVDFTYRASGRRGGAWPPN